MPVLIRYLIFNTLHPLYGYKQTNKKKQNKMRNKLKLLVAMLAFSPAIVLAQTETTPAEDIEAAAGTANTVFAAFAVITVAVFVFKMVMKFAKKGS